MTQPTRILSLAAVFAALAACSGPVGDPGGLAGIGGTGIGTGGGGNVAGIGGTGITTTGTITGFGSIFVNGIEFDTGSARISLDDSPGGEDDLGLGMVVTVTGTVDDSGRRGVAEQVVFDDAVQGPVATITPSPDGQRKTLAVLGVRVLAERASTVFEHTGFDSLQPGDVVEVSGFVNGDGLLHATRIEKKIALRPGESEIERKGVISGLDTAAQRFTLDGLTVDYRNAELKDLPGGLADGQAVEVKGSLAGGLIQATRIEAEDEPLSGASGRVSLEGLVSDFVSRDDFRVNGQRVDASQARLEPAGLVLANGREVEVEGTLVDGVLKAEKVEARGGDIELAARLAAVDSSAGTLTLDFFPGTVTVRVDSRSLLHDDEGGQPLRLDQLAPGDFVTVKGYLAGAAVVASKVKREKEPDDDVLRGPASACDGSQVTVLGLSYALQPGVTEFDDDEDAGAFCAAVNAGQGLVEIEDKAGRRDGIADKAEREGGD